MRTQHFLKNTAGHQEWRTSVFACKNARRDSGETSDSEHNDSANSNANLASTINRCLEALDSLDFGTNTAGFKMCVEKLLKHYSLHFNFQVTP
jgi:hypothetical protein